MKIRSATLKRLLKAVMNSTREALENDRFKESLRGRITTDVHIDDITDDPVEKLAIYRELSSGGKTLSGRIEAATGFAAKASIGYDVITTPSLFTVVVDLSVPEISSENRPPPENDYQRGLRKAVEIVENAHKEAFLNREEASSRMLNHDYQKFRGQETLLSGITAQLLSELKAAETLEIVDDSDFRP